MANQIGQEAGALKAIAKRVDEAKADFKKESNLLDNQIQAMANKWQGEGGNAFRALHVAWVEKHEKINNVLDNFRDSLEQTEADNVSTDQQAGGNMTNLATKLGGI